MFLIRGLYNPSVTRRRKCWLLTSGSALNFLWKMGLMNQFNPPYYQLNRLWGSLVHRLCKKDHINSDTSSKKQSMKERERERKAEEGPIWGSNERQMLILIPELLAFRAPLWSHSPMAMLWSTFPDRHEPCRCHHSYEEAETAAEDQSLTIGIISWLTKYEDYMNWNLFVFYITTNWSFVQKALMIIHEVVQVFL